ncbi:hypothetical protein [Natronococcus sp. A-GB7]|uniref:hypothetical protein n=1 Tax=Natronococcus sp. A-GB7 TaxID=3037649 RepID=UPI00241C7F4A|nr:hypothetical protein [Natronococcus sp. A-GB7]MDG5821079.1 hypothetical protein [Natronococcus sp. A-GB7]
MDRPSTFSRRTLLATVGTVGPLTFAGCTVDHDEGYEPEPDPVEDHTPIGYRLPDLPVREFTDELDAGLEAGLEATATDTESFGTALERDGIAVDRLVRERNYLYLEYVADAPETGVLREVGYVAGAYVPYVLASTDPATLDATILERDGIDFGRFTGYVNWVRAVDASEEPLAAYGERVLETLKTKR